ncbi:MAG: hypothetical protein AAF629_01155, partial [Chloroflexota bacterium]
MVTPNAPETNNASASVNTLSDLVQQYQTLVESLTNQETLDENQALSCLLLRDQIADLAKRKEIIAPETVQILALADQALKALTIPFSNLANIDEWRDSLAPPPESWWWHLNPPLKERILSFYEKFDWIWDTLNIVTLTIILALVFDIIPRFYRGGADTTGAFAIVIQSVLTMVTAGGILTKTGAEVIERVLKNYKVPQILWHEIRLGLALMMLFTLLVFRNQGLPALAQGYHRCGQQLHYQEGQLLAAQHNYERALE